MTTPKKLEILHGRHKNLKRHESINKFGHLLWLGLDGIVVGERLQKNCQHSRPEGRQAGVVDDVEGSDQEPGLGRPREVFPGLRVMNEVPDGLPSVPFFGLDGRATQNRWFVIRHGVVSPDKGR